MNDRNIFKRYIWNKNEKKWQLVDEELEMMKINCDFPEDSELNQPNAEWEIIPKKSRKKKYKWELIEK